MNSEYRVFRDAAVDQLRSLLSDVRLRLALIDELNAGIHDADLAWLVGEIRMQEIVILAKLSGLGIEV